MGKKHQLSLSAELDSSTAFQAFIDEASSAADLDKQTSYDIKLAVDEACMNIIQHGYEGMDPGTIVVSLQYGAQQVVIRITDFGHPFEPSEPPKPNRESILDDSSGGFGLLFIYQSVDSVSYEVTESGNTLTLIKRLEVDQNR
jgi:anti-sigma regulatory factor (Ser/Thr protein kinase)